MTPAARYQAAIEIIDRVCAGEAAEKALTSWARASRFAGSKDRAAVRDHVFDVLRMWRSTAALGGGETGRARVLGLLRAGSGAHGGTPEEVFTGQGHAPAPLTSEETAGGRTPDGPEAWDLPDWLAVRFATDLGAAAEETALALRARAPVFLRVNLAKGDVAQAQERLASEGIETRPHDLAVTALEVTAGARKVARSEAFTAGLVELQDAASQAVIADIPAADPARILDYCAGGGGKALAMAARFPSAKIFAHDADPGRMSDLPARAKRAGARVTVSEAPSGSFDLVLTDVPCSGSGAWRRAPEGKWRLDEAGLARLNAVQAEILDKAARLVAPGGWLVHATCSVLTCENTAQVERFAADHPGWQRGPSRQFLPKDGGDGFFFACLRRV